MSADPTRAPARRWRLRAVLSACALALVAIGAVFTVRAHQADAAGASANRAVVDVDTSHQVISQVSTALGQVLSYSYSDPSVAQKAAAHWLTGDAVKQYDELFAQLQQRAPGQQLTFVAKVDTAGVITLHGTQATVLVFLDQRSTRASDHQSSVAAAQVQIGAVRHGSLWQIDELKPL